MDNYRELGDRLRQATGRPRAALMQGIVRKTDGITCDVEVDGLVVPGVRLRATEAEDGAHILITPKEGTGCIVGSLSGDLSQLVVLAVDHAEGVTVNGGLLGGLINIAALTDKINALVKAFNAHTHKVTVSHPGGTYDTLSPTSGAEEFDRKDYEDDKVTH